MRGSTFDCFAVLFTFLMILLPSGTACAVDENSSPVISEDRFFTEWGFYTGAGYGQVEEGPYVPIFFILHLGVDTKRWLSSLQEHRGTLSLFIEPQI